MNQCDALLSTNIVYTLMLCDCAFAIQCFDVFSLLVYQMMMNNKKTHSKNSLTKATPKQNVHTQKNEIKLRERKKEREKNEENIKIKSTHNSSKCKRVNTKQQQKSYHLLYLVKQKKKTFFNAFRVWVWSLMRECVSVCVCGTFVGNLLL